MNTLKTLPSVTGTKLINMNIKPLESIIIPILPIGGIGILKISFSKSIVIFLESKLSQ